MNYVLYILFKLYRIHTHTLLEIRDGSPEKFGWTVIILQTLTVLKLHIEDRNLGGNDLLFFFPASPPSVMVTELTYKLQSHISACARGKFKKDGHLLW